MDGLRPPSSPAGQDRPEPSRERVVLDASPALGRLYARAAARGLTGPARRALRAPDPTPRLPAVELVVPEVPVEPVAHAAFCRVVQAPLRSLPGGGVEAFSGYLHALSFPVAMALLTRRDVPFPVVGLVHLANAVRHERAVGVGESVSVAVRARHLRPHRAGAAFDVVAELRRAEDDEPVWTGVSTYLARGLRLDGAPADAGRAERPPFEPPQPTGRWRLGPQTGRRYAEVSGDVNPIHLSAVSARALGMKGAIAHGMYTASRALALLDAPTPVAWEVEFGAPLVLPSTVAVGLRRDGRGAAFRGGAVTVWDARRARPHAVLTASALAGP